MLPRIFSRFLKNRLEIRNLSLLLFNYNITKLEVIMIDPIKILQIMKHLTKLLKIVYNMNLIYILKNYCLVVSILTNRQQFVFTRVGINSNINVLYHLRVLQRRLTKIHHLVIIISSVIQFSFGIKKLLFYYKENVILIFAQIRHRHLEILNHIVILFFTLFYLLMEEISSIIRVIKILQLTL